MAARFDIGLTVTSRTLSLSELAARLGREPQSGSHDKGEARGLLARGLTWPCTIWRENASDADTPWHERGLRLLQQMPPNCAELLAAEPNDISVSLDVAVFYETAYVSLHVPKELLNELSAKGVDVEITTYPVQRQKSSG